MAILLMNSTKLINRIGPRLFPSSSILPYPPRQGLLRQLCRTIHDDNSSTPTPATEQSPLSPSTSLSDTSSPTTSRWDSIKNSFNFAKASNPSVLKVGEDVTLHGFLGKRRDMNASLTFCPLEHADYNLQIVSSWAEKDSLQHAAHQSLKKVPAYSPVSVSGTLVQSQNIPSPNEDWAMGKTSRKTWDLKLRSIQCLNPFPSDIIVSKDAVWPAKARHLQLRFDTQLRDRLRLRHNAILRLYKLLHAQGFTALETPILFKSTPEGAREFLVPTRSQGHAYALPQSPQQYKQVLMAGGINKYFQFARCFRDEDHRADRQPEFTQLDLEMAFSDSRDVMLVVETLVKSVCSLMVNNYIPFEINGRRHPVYKGKGIGEQPSKDIRTYKGKLLNFPITTYQNAMKMFGSDKPDFRIKAPQTSDIIRVEHFLPEHFISKITSLENPIVEACKFRLKGTNQESMELIHKFFDELPQTTNKLASHSTPGVLLFDSTKPLQGLSSLDYTAADQLSSIYGHFWPQCEDGDIIIVHARENKPFQGEGSTELGRIRRLIYEVAVKEGRIPRSDALKFAWVVQFPMFTPNRKEDPGQGGGAGFSSTHHPFTAPYTPEDFDLLTTDPLSAKADHYDLVLNGVEIGGGSRRIHSAELQEYVMRDILEMTDQGVDQFAHLLEALRGGCPPHAGFAFGFDRFLTVLCDVDSVRDVMAFPKNNKGQDVMVGSPSKTTPEQNKTYHLFDPALAKAA